MTTNGAHPTPRVVALAMNRWEGAWMNRQQILSRLGRRYPVLYSTGAWSTWDFDDPEWRRAPWTGAFDRVDSVLVDRAPALLLRVRNRAGLERIAVAAAADRWRRRLSRFGRGPLIGYVFHPRMWPYARALRPDVLVYHAYDIFRLQAGWSETTAAHERELVAHAHQVIATSDVIAEELRRVGAAGPVVVPNGADYDAYAIDPSGPEPADLASIARPRVGYIGKLSRKVDLPLVARLATAHPQWQFVFVGSNDKLDAESAAGVALTRPLPNVHFLGFKPHTELPQYACRMDVNVICHRTDDNLWTKGTFPLKLFEYLAAGPPVVSSDIPSVRPYGDVVAIASSAEAWDSAICAMLQGGPDAGNKAARRAVARRNTWDHRVEQIEGLLTPLVSAC